MSWVEENSLPGQASYYLRYAVDVGEDQPTYLKEGLTDKIQGRVPADTRGTCIDSKGGIFQFEGGYPPNQRDDESTGTPLYQTSSAVKY